MGIKELEINIEITEIIEKLRKRPTDELAAALVFVISELMVLRGDINSDHDMVEVFMEAGKEAITLTEGLFLATPSYSKETIH